MYLCAKNEGWVLKCGSRTIPILQEEGHLVGRHSLLVHGAGLGQDGVDLRAGNALGRTNVLEEGLDAIGGDDLDEVLLEAGGKALPVAALVVLRKKCRK